MSVCAWDKANMHRVFGVVLHEKRVDCFPCDEYSSCKGENKTKQNKRLALSIFIALVLPAHLSSGFQ